MKYLVVWNEAEAEANNILRRAMQQVKYPWAWRKLNSARFHIIERHTVRVEDGFQGRNAKIVTNGDADEAAS